MCVPRRRSLMQKKVKRDASIFDSFWTVSVIFVPPPNVHKSKSEFSNSKKRIYPNFSPSLEGTN